MNFVKQPNLKLKTWLKQLLGFLPLAFELPRQKDIFIKRPKSQPKINKISLGFDVVQQTIIFALLTLSENKKKTF